MVVHRSHIETMCLYLCINWHKPLRPSLALCFDKKSISHNISNFLGKNLSVGFFQDLYTRCSCILLDELAVLVAHLVLQAMTYRDIGVTGALPAEGASQQHLYHVAIIYSTTPLSSTSAKQSCAVT